MGQQALRRIRRAWVLFVLSDLAVLYAGTSLAQDLRRIHYGTTTSTAHLPIWVAKDAGLFAKNGLNVEPVQIRGGALITMGIMSGQLQFSGAGAESVVAARIDWLRNRGANPFADYQVPLAILTLKQGLGRLIRHRNDRGVLSILDPRVRTMAYGRRFLESLPPAPITSNLADIDRFFGTDE
jgi:hypothetical protein